MDDGSDTGLAGGVESVPLLELDQISKSFGRIQALKNIDLSVEPGEIVGLLGDNGAGKSTLVKIIAGVETPDAGHITWLGQQIRKMNVSKARELGIECVYQERALADDLPLWRNIFMGRELQAYGTLEIERMRRHTRKLMEAMRFTSSAIDPDAPIKNFSGGERQGIAIARALYFGAKLVILDEPTMGLSLNETEKVIGFVREIKRQGQSCIFIDHNIFHVHSLADRLVVMDRGRIYYRMWTGPSGMSLERLIEHMRLIASRAVEP